MVVVNAPPPELAPQLLTPYSASDELLQHARILIFHGRASLKTEHVQAHVFSPAGLYSYPKLVLAPNSQAYEAVECLLPEDKGDEICRALTFSLYKHFLELPESVRSTWRDRSKARVHLPSAPELFSREHAAIVAAKMVKVENGEEVLRDVTRALAVQHLSWLDMDVVLPPGSLAELRDRGRESGVSEEEEEDSANARYGNYAPLIKLFGEPAFLPTSKLRRAPSRPTGISRSKLFRKQQKENLRREMVEFVDTEENYVGKMYDLLHSVAEDFRAKARDKSPNSMSPSEEALEGLFPSSLDEILDANNGFLEAIREILKETENAAIRDIDTAGDEPYTIVRNENSEPTDVTGTLAFANCLVDWFPNFAECYAAYIQAHSQFGQYLRVFLKETGSSFSRRVQETGEQRLMSMLIEPVQRLPRYSLYIDNIIKQLPMRHPAIKPLLKARDMIGDICSRDSPANHQGTTLARLMQLIPSWPRDFKPQGRLISAMDVVELPPPYREDLKAKGTSPGILLLFSDCLVHLIKSQNQTISARGLVAEIDNPTIPDPSENNQTTFASLICVQYMKLSNLWFTEVGDGDTVQMLHSRESGQDASASHSLNATSVCMFHLGGAYERKAAKWLEETVKARVEGRFSESERESPKWETRCYHGDLNLFSALFEAKNGQPDANRQAPARVQVIIDPPRGTRVPEVGEAGIEIVAFITPAGGDVYQIEVKGISGFLARDRVVLADVLPTLNKRLGSLLQMRSQIRNPALTGTWLFRNQDVLKKLKLEMAEDEIPDTYDRSHRSGSASPVKMLSNFFSGSVKGESPSPRKLQRAPISLGEVPRLKSPANSLSPFKTPSRPTSRDELPKANVDIQWQDPSSKLSNTLASYCLALQARKGNIVGKVIRNRAFADETAVNELYNSLLEEPNNHELAAQAAVDVLFAAFDKFVKLAWKKEMGPIMSMEVLNKIQAQAESEAASYPGGFEEIVRRCTSELTIDNQEALRASVRLLSDLLAGMSSDADRGLLTGAFAEILVSDGRPHDFIPLLDRLIEDQDAIFGRPVSSGSATPSQGSMGSRYRATNTGSLNSHTSSLKKRFGFGSLRRENSKSESEETRGNSVWRTLSKTARGDRGHGHTGSLSKGTPLVRSNSTEIDPQESPKRPTSRERPTVLGAFPFENSPSHGSVRVFGAALGTIGEGHEVAPRRKRRSSLGDLRELQANQAINNTPPAWTPSTPRRTDPVRRDHTASPQTPVQNKPSAIPNPTRFGTPNRKENSPGPVTLPRPLLTRPKTVHESDGSGTFSGLSRALQRPRSVYDPVKPPPPPPKTDEVTVTTQRPAGPRHKRSDTVSGTPPVSLSPSLGPRRGSSSAIPTLHRPTSSVSSVSSIPSALSERPGIGNRPKTSSGSDDKKTPEPSLGAAFSPARTTRRLRMQSPQKLRERLLLEKAAIANAETGMTAQLASLKDELGHDHPRAKAIEASCEANFAELHRLVREKGENFDERIREIDEKLVQAYRENEAIYSLFNEHLAKSLGKNKGNAETEAAKMELIDAWQQVAAVKKENNRLKHENALLKAYAKDD